MTGPPAIPDYLALDDDALLAQCEVTNARGSGPGGQHRNKNETGVRIRHLPTGCIGQAFERRHRAQNFANAVSRLRREIALNVRRPVDFERFEVPPALAAILPGAPSRLGPNNDRYWAGVQCLLDLFAALDGSVADASAALGLSTGALSRVLVRDDAVMAAANRIRGERGLAPLRR